MNSSEVRKALQPGQRKGRRGRRMNSSEVRKVLQRGQKRGREGGDSSEALEPYEKPGETRWRRAARKTKTQRKRAARRKTVSRRKVHTRKD